VVQRASMSSIHSIELILRKYWLFNSSMWWRCRRPKRRPLCRSFTTQHSPVKPCEVPRISTHTRVLLAPSRPRPSPSFPFGSIFLITGTRSDCCELTVLIDDDEMAVVIYMSRPQNRVIIPQGLMQALHNNGRIL
jgi:hypothetical protein